MDNILIYYTSISNISSTNNLWLGNSNDLKNIGVNSYNILKGGKKNNIIKKYLRISGFASHFQ